MLHMRWNLQQPSRKRTAPKIDVKSDWKPKLTPEEAMKESAKELVGLAESGFERCPPAAQQAAYTTPSEPYHLENQQHSERRSPEMDAGCATQNASADEGWATSSQHSGGEHSGDETSESGDSSRAEVDDGAVAMLLALAGEGAPATAPGVPPPRRGQKRPAPLALTSMVPSMNFNLSSTTRDITPKSKSAKKALKPKWQPQYQPKLPLPQPASPPAPSESAPWGSSLGSGGVAPPAVWMAAKPVASAPAPESAPPSARPVDALQMMVWDDAIAPAPAKSNPKAKRSKAPESNFKWKPLKVGKVVVGQM